MKKLNWDTIPSQNVLGKVNVWTSQRPQRDLVLDVQAMEELFSHVDKAATLRSSRRGGVKALGGLELFPLEHQVNRFQPDLMSPFYWQEALNSQQEQLTIVVSTLRNMMRFLGSLFASSFLMGDVILVLKIKREEVFPLIGGFCCVPGHDTRC